MTNERFRDGGARLGRFTTTIDVVCPSCGRRGSARPSDDDRAARVVCHHCSFATTSTESGWLGPVAGRVSRRCPSCGRRVERRLHGPRHDHPAHVVCDCGCQVDAEIHWEPVPVEGTDPFFGLDLWLRVPFRGELLWAYNAEHLSFLRGYVSAGLREREPRQNGSIASRLPKWITSAKHRDDLLAEITTLDARARQP